MSGDYYGVLGVSPTSEDVVIRAAYRALMRRYHPDADPASDASQRAQAINAAYSVLSDPEKRARYDGSLAAQGLIKPDFPPPSGMTKRLLPGPAGFIGFSALAATATMLAISPPIGILPVDGLPPLSAEPQDSRSTEPEEDTSIPSGESSAPSIATSARNEVPNAMLEPPQEIVAPADLPDAPAVRRVRAEQSRQKPVIEAGMPQVRAAKREAPSPTQKSAAGAVESAASCRLGNGWADRAICRSANLTALDRQYGLLYAQSLARADETRRAALQGSRERFQQRRNACRSENCLTNTYIARLREVSDIMARGAQ